MPSHWCRWRLSGAVQYLVGAVMPSGGRPANRQLLEAGRAIFSASSRWLAPEVQRTFGQELVLGFTLSGAVEDAVSLLAAGRAHGARARGSREAAETERPWGEGGSSPSR